VRRGTAAVTGTFRIATIGGDGVGPEVISAALPAIEKAAALDGAGIAWEPLPLGADHYLRTGETLPDPVFQHLRDGVDAILVGALGDPRIPGNEPARDILLGLRFRLDLYVNFRPVKLLHPDLTPLRADRRAGGPAVDFVIFRENTEGAYTGAGAASAVDTDQESQIAHEVHTAPKVSRIIRAAFEWAASHGKTLVTMADKSNAVPAHRLWQRLFSRIAGDYPGIRREHRYIDAIAMEFVRNPDRFQVVVTGNLYGDILSDLGAALVGGLGLAPSANLHPGRPGMFEPVHGSAPNLAGRGIANPMAAVLTGALMLGELGCPRGAAALERAVVGALEAGVRTPDVGGTSSTGEVGEWISNAVT
jgi:3-isopropylmalate dehydrogenase